LPIDVVDAVVVLVNFLAAVARTGRDMGTPTGEGAPLRPWAAFCCLTVRPGWTRATCLVSVVLRQNLRSTSRAEASRQPGVYARWKTKGMRGRETHVFLHEAMRHWYGRLPVWIRRWRASEDESENDFAQTEQTCGRSPVLNGRKGRKECQQLSGAEGRRGSEGMLRDGLDASVDRQGRALDEGLAAADMLADERPGGHG
jgi:hypothetical protein